MGGRMNTRVYMESPPYRSMNTITALQNKIENRVTEAQIFERKSLDKRINETTKLHYIEVAKAARQEAQTLMNEVMDWTD
jgi:hypothetical protein